MHVTRNRNILRLFFCLKQKQDGAKRSLSVSGATDFDGAKRKLPERGIYTPPSGKYSTSNTTSQANNSNGGNKNGNGTHIKRRTYSNGSNRGAANNNGGGRRRF